MSEYQSAEQKANPKPDWCICDAAWWDRGLLDPSCRHDEQEEIEELQAKIVQFEAALDAVTPSHFGCNVVEIERDRFGVSVHVDGTRLEQSWPVTAKEADDE